MRSKLNIKLSARLTSTLILLVALLLVLVCASYSWFVDPRYVPQDEDFYASSITAYYAGGTGTVDDPYIIREARHFYNLAWLQNSGVYDDVEGGVHFKLDNNLDMSGKLFGVDETKASGAIPPIGTDESPFRGTFNGNGKTISNLWISTNEEDWKEHPDQEWSFSGESVGLFGAVGENSLITGFKLDRIEVKTDIDSATVGIICGTVKNGSHVSNIGVYNGILSFDDNVSVDSKYSLVGHIEDQVKWVDKPGEESGSGSGGDGSVGGGGDDGGNVVINANEKNANGQYLIEEIWPENATKAIPVPNSSTGRAFYTGARDFVRVGGGPNGFRQYNELPDVSGSNPKITAVKNNTKTFSYVNGDEESKGTIASFNLLDLNPIYYFVPDGVPRTDSMVEVTNAAQEKVSIPSNGVWFDPKVDGVASLAFMQTNKKDSSYMSVYVYERTSATTVKLIKEIVFCIGGDIDNKNIVYFECPVSANYEYVIGESSVIGLSPAGFVAMVLAGSSDDGGGGQTPGEGEEPFPDYGEEGYFVENVIVDVDYVTSTSVDLTDPTYKQHQVILAISGTTTSGGKNLTYMAQSDGKVYYSPPGNLGLTITDHAAQDPKLSQSSSDASIFLNRDQY